MSLKEVKGKIRAVKKIHQVTKAMEAVSAVKMRQSQAVALETRPFALHAMGILRRLVRRGTTKNHPLVKRRQHEKKIILVVVTSDRGLAGAHNTYVIKAAHKEIKARGWSKKELSIFAIGKKGYEHFKRQGYEVLDHYERWGEGVALGDPNQLARKLMGNYSRGECDRVSVVYSNFQSTFVQEPVVRRLLPISFHALEDVIEGIVPKKGKFSEQHDVYLKDMSGKYSYEPSTEEVLFELFPYLVGVMLYHVVLEANASEHSARMVAMKSASDHARDLTKDLTLKYNKERQTAITAEVSEITSGIEAMR